MSHHGCDLTSDWDSSWCYVQGGTACDKYEDSRVLHETRKWRRCNLTSLSDNVTDDETSTSDDMEDIVTDNMTDDENRISEEMDDDVTDDIEDNVMDDDYRTQPAAHPTPQITTTTATITCGSVVVTHASDLSECTGLGEGSVCNVSCKAGYVWPLSVGLRCARGGFWEVSAACTKEGASTTLARVVMIDLLVQPMWSSIPEVFDADWAETNVDLFISSVASMLAVSPENVRVDVGLGSMVRVLSGAESFPLPPETFLLKIRIRSLESDTSAPEAGRYLVCALFSCSSVVSSGDISAIGDSSFVSVGALLEMKTGTSLVNRVISSLKSSERRVPGGLAMCSYVPSRLTFSEPVVVVVDNFVWEIPFWIEGAWSECSDGCGEGISIRSVSCSVGPAVSCGGHSMPAYEQICEESRSCVFHLNVVHVGFGVFVAIFVGFAVFAHTNERLSIFSLRLVPRSKTMSATKW